MVAAGRVVRGCQTLRWGSQMYSIVSIQKWAQGSDRVTWQPAPALSGLWSRICALYSHGYGHAGSALQCLTGHHFIQACYGDIMLTEPPSSEGSDRRGIFLYSFCLYEGLCRVPLAENEDGEPNSSTINGSQNLTHSILSHFTSGCEVGMWEELLCACWLGSIDMVSFLHKIFYLHIIFEHLLTISSTHYLFFFQYWVLNSGPFHWVASPVLFRLDFSFLFFFQYWNMISVSC